MVFKGARVKQVTRDKSVLVLGVLAVGLAMFIPAIGQEAPAGVHEIKMTAKNYSFDPGVMTVRKGEKVRLIITATDRDHGIQLKAFEIDQVLKKDAPTIIEFTASKAGNFEFKCSVYCGMGHRRMKGKLVVEE